MLIATTNELPGYVIDEVYGEVFGLTVRSRNAFSQMGAGLKSMLGGELKGMTKVLVDSRIVDTIGENRRTPSAKANPVISSTGAKTFRRPAMIAPPNVGSKKYF